MSLLDSRYGFMVWSGGEGQVRETAGSWDLLWCAEGSRRADKQELLEWRMETWVGITES